MPARLALALILVAACAGEPLGEDIILAALGYQDRTNVGPETARGTVTVDPVSGEVLIEVSGLPDVAPDDIYEGWLAGGGERPLSLGKFAVEPSGSTLHGKNVGNIAERTFARVELTLEREPDDSPKPSIRVSIGGEL